MADDLDQQGNHVLGIGHGLQHTPRGSRRFPPLELLLVSQGLAREVDHGARRLRALQTALAVQVRERRLDVRDVQKFFQFAGGHSRGAEFNLAQDGIGQRSPLAEANVPVGPQSLFVELGDAGERVVLGVVVVAGEVPLLVQDPPSGHGRTAAGLEEFGLGEDLFAGERLEHVAGGEAGGFHGGLHVNGIVITLMHKRCYYYIILVAVCQVRHAGKTTEQQENRVSSPAQETSP